MSYSVIAARKIRKEGLHKISEFYLYLLNYHDFLALSGMLRSSHVLLSTRLITVSRNNTAEQPSRSSCHY